MLILFSTTTPAIAQGEHSRRAAAELHVIIADVRQLSNITALEISALHQQGLEQRVAGGLSSLAILLRMSDQERGKPPKSYLGELTRARELLHEADWNSLLAHLATLEDSLNLAIPAFPVSNEAVENALELHKRMCAACHDHPITEVTRPAYNLYEQARLESEKEFFARMLVGVRGDRITGIDNPLNDLQLLALIELYRRGTGQD